uniref:Mucin-1 n=1 Tax=Castor canadensis TaxID=51338 RepID=A0A8C0X1U9_CASCN
MTRGFQVPFFLLLLLMLTTGEGHKAGRGLSLLTCCPFPVTRPGSVVVESTMIFREGTISASQVELQLIQHEKENNYDLVISKVSAHEVPFPSSAQSGSGVPGWGIALLVLVCVLVTLAIVYFIALAVCQCRRKNYGQLDIFPTRDAYHPMSEYPTYHTHGRYVPPGSTKRSPYEEISSGNGGSGLSYTNPAAAVTSANL